MNRTSTSDIIADDRRINDMLSICIVNYNGGDLLLKCLNSIQAHPPLRDYEILVVDNNSVDGSQVVCAKYDRVKLIQNDHNVGFAVGNNQAFAYSRGNLILMLNADTEVYPDALDRLLAFADSNPDCGLVSARLINPDGTTQIGFNVRRFPTVLSALAQLLLWDELLPRNPITRRSGYYDLDYTSVQNVEQPAASALLIRREALNDIKGFDARFVNWYNDVDLCKRVYNHGWRIVYFPDAPFLHYGGRGSGFRLAKNLIRESNRSQRLYFYVHHGVVAYTLLSIATILGMLARVIALSIPEIARHARVNARNYQSRSDLIEVFQSVIPDTVATFITLPRFGKVVPDEQ